MKVLLLCLVSQSLQMLDLKMSVEELHMENEYQLRLKDMSYNEKIRELTANFNQQIHTLKTRLQVCQPISQSIKRKLTRGLTSLMEVMVVSGLLLCRRQKTRWRGRDVSIRRVQHKPLKNTPAS